MVFWQSHKNQGHGIHRRLSSLANFHSVFAAITDNSAIRSDDLSGAATHDKKNNNKKDDEEKVLRFNQSIILIKHFHEHIAILSRPSMLELLALANTMPITNQDVRALLKVTRNGALYWLSQLVALNLLEMRDHHYRPSPYCSALVHALSLTLRSVVSGRAPQVFEDVGMIKLTANNRSSKRNASWPILLELASQGLENLYARGRIDQSEYDSKSRLLNELSEEQHQKQKESA